MIELVDKKMTAWEWECRHARRDADPNNQNEHVREWKRQPWYFEKIALPALKKI